MNTFRRSLDRTGEVLIALVTGVHLLHKKCGSRVRNQSFCPVCKVAIERDETVRGYEVSKGQYVRVEDAELEALEAEANSNHRNARVHPDRESRPDLFRDPLLSTARQRSG